LGLSRKISYVVCVIFYKKPERLGSLAYHQGQIIIIMLLAILDFLKQSSFEEFFEHVFPFVLFSVQGKMPSNSIFARVQAFQPFSKISDTVRCLFLKKKFDIPLPP